MTLPPTSVRPARGDDMLPLINIVFLLMIFFMLLGAMSAPDPFALDPASSRALPRADHAHRSLVIAADGRLGLDGAVFDLDSLPEHVERWRRSVGTAVLVVRADASADAAMVVRVMAVLDAAGLDRIELLMAAARDQP